MAGQTRAQTIWQRIRSHSQNINPSFMIVGALLSTTLLLGAILTSVKVSADDPTVENVSVTVSTSCTMTGTGTNHTATTVNGIVYSGQDLGLTTLKAFCNDSNGFAIYAIGFTDDEDGKNVLTSSTLGSSHDIQTGTNTSGNSSWAFKLGTVSSPTPTYPIIIAGSTGDTLKQTGDTDYSSYAEIPDDYAKVAYRTASTDVGSSAEGSTLTADYQVFIGNTQPAGTYIGQVKYVLVHPSTAAKPVAPLKATDCPASSICYAPNAGDIEGTMASLGTTTNLTNISPLAGKVSATSNSTTTLIAPNFKRDGYGFAGWSTDFTATNSSTIYGPNELIDTGDLSTNGMILYPVWVASTGNLQDFSCSGSGLTQATYDSSISTNKKMVATLSSVTALTDTRDGNVYAVAKLADGQCWMVENLRLDPDDSTDSSLAQGFGGTFTGLPASTDSWNTSNYTLAQFNNNNTNIGGTNASSENLVAGYNTNTTTAQWYDYGNYYSWAAAMANTNSLTSYTASEGANTSICPTGWHLPYGNSSNTGNTAGGFYYLNTRMANNTSTQGSKDWRMFPNNFVYSGYWGGSSAGNRGIYGGYWSSSANGSNVAYYLLFYSTGVNPGTDGSSKSNGSSVRCVAGS